MAQRERRTTLEERIEISERGAASLTDPVIAAGMAFSIWTARKWRGKAQ